MPSMEPSDARYEPQDDHLGSLSRIDKLLVLEQVVARRLETAGSRETAGLSRELRDCWREIEELMSLADVAGSESDDELAERRDRVAAARQAAAQAAASP